MTDSKDDDEKRSEYIHFKSVLDDERLAVADRRAMIKRSGKLDLSSQSIVALSLSGGGIRSASICLGACQALHDLGVWDDFDYVSTVSGGSYIGSSISLQAQKQNCDIEKHHKDKNRVSSPDEEVDQADESHDVAQDLVAPKFPFVHRPGSREGLAFRHLRANTSYLTTGTLAERASTPLQLSRSFIRNVIALTPILLIAAAIYCIFYGELITSLKGILIGGSQLQPMTLIYEPDVIRPSRIIFTAFGATTSWAFVMAVLFALTFFLKYEQQRFVEKVIVTIFAVSAFVFTLEATALAVAGYDLVFSQPAKTANEDNNGNWFVGGTIFLILIVLIISQLILRRLGGTAKLPVGKIALFAVSVGVPLLLWATFFLMVRWQINWDSSPSKLKYAVGAVDYLNQITGEHVLSLFEIPMSALAHFPKMLALGFHGEYLPSYDAVHQNTIALTLLVLVVGLFWLLIVRRANPNDSALHTIYKEKLANLFMFHIHSDEFGKESVVDASNTRMSALAKPSIPILLINGAIAGIRVTRDSTDLEPSVGFTFSPYHVGYEDCYCETKTYESYDDSITLASVVAISGAAVTPRMNGALSRPASMLIAILNLRLGYWLPNPKHYDSSSKGLIDKIPKLRHLLYEVLGSDSRNEKHIYLSDGGHYENLGVLELLRRKCTLVVALDAEHDPDFTFPSLAKLIRIARVRLGVNISIDASNVAPSRGMFSDSHFAVGEIDYGNGEIGKILYIKSSLSGDENHYVLNYACSNENFPHESTLDQFFSDQQFEAYRALGYHMAKKSLSEYIDQTNNYEDNSPQSNDSKEPDDVTPQLNEKFEERLTS